MLLKRITGRRISPDGVIYNIYTNPPKVEASATSTARRSSSAPTTPKKSFNERMKAFHDKTSAVIEYYRSHGGRFAEVNGDQPVEDVTHEIRKALLALRHHPEQ